jgi:hypothetical protein
MILIASWLVVGLAVMHWAIDSLPVAAMMGLVAFCLLIALEFLLERFAFGGSLATFIGKIGQGPGLVGLLGQIAFGLMPIAAAARRRT